MTQEETDIIERALKQSAASWASIHMSEETIQQWYSRGAGEFKKATTLFGIELVASPLLPTSFAVAMNAARDVVTLLDLRTAEEKCNDAIDAAEDLATRGVLHG